MKVVTITFVEIDGYWQINIDGKLSNRVKEKVKTEALRRANAIAYEHNYSNSRDNIMEMWNVEYLNEIGSKITIVNFPPIQ